MTKDELDEVFKFSAGEHPEIIKKYLQKEISLDTLAILNGVFEFIRRYDRKITDPVYQEVSRKCKKYQPFLKVDMQKMTSIVKKKLGLL